MEWEEKHSKNVDKRRLWVTNYWQNTVLLFLNASRDFGKIKCIYIYMQNLPICIYWELMTSLFIHQLYHWLTTEWPSATEQIHNTKTNKYVSISSHLWINFCYFCFWTDKIDLILIWTSGLKVSMQEQNKVKIWIQLEYF